MSDIGHSLSNTALVVLGMLAGGPKTGYDIKALVDQSTRFFWSASYGQIYPDLRALEQDGLVRGESVPRGGRARRLYELTPEGREALHSWLASRAELTHEIRDEGVLKLFFSDALTPAERLDNLIAMRERYEGIAARLSEKSGPPGELDGRETSAALTARFGTDMYEWLATWCRRTEEELRRGEGS